MSEEKIVTDDISKNKVISSLIWKFMEVGGTQIIRFIVQVVLARLLCPEDYGIMAILLAFITISDCFVTYGIGTSLVQKKDADDLDYSSIFYMTEVTALVLYLILFFCAPLISKFYHMELLTKILRILAVILFFDAVNAVQTAIVQKTMQFKKLFLSNMGAFLVSGIAGVILAIKGFGVWTLVAQQLLNVFLMTVILWFTVNWRPKFIFSFERVKKLYGFGWKLMFSALLDVLYKQLYSLTIGRVYSKENLGNFNKGEQFPSMIESALDGSIQSVMLPALVAKNENKDELKKMVRKTLKTSCFIVFPCMFGLAGVSNNLVLILLTDKWIGCVPFLILSCFFFLFYPIQITNLTVINANGRSDIYLKLEIIKKVIGLSILFVTLPFGLITMAWGRILSVILATIISMYPNKKIIDYSINKQIKDILPAFILGLLMFFLVYSLGMISISPILCLLIQISGGVAFYVLNAVIFKMEAYMSLKNILMNKLGKKNENNTI